MKVIKIYAIWCSGCLVMNQVWDRILKKYPIETISLDYDLNEDEVKVYQPGNILPVFIFFHQNQEIGRIVGEKSEKEMISYMKEIGVLSDED